MLLLNLFRDRSWQAVRVNLFRGFSFSLTMTALFLTTLLHAVVHRDLFPNDISIAITERRRKPIFAEEMRPSKRRGGGTKQQQAALDTAASDAADLEAARAAATSYT